MLFLIDQDAVLSDFESALLTIWRERYPDRMYIPIEQRRTFYAEDQYPNEFRDDIKAIKKEAGFFRSLPPIDGAKEGIGRIVAAGHQAIICTAPIAHLTHTVAEKLDWIAEHFGCELARTAIVTRDKTFIRGDFLIDDRPDLNGALEPAWQQLLFDAPYNRHLETLHRISWQTLPAFLASLKA